MFERTDKDEIDSEKIISGLKNEGVGVEYLIIGSVSEFGRSSDSEGRIFGRSKTQRAFAKVNVRLVDVSTGRIIYSEEGAGESINSAKSGDQFVRVNLLTPDRPSKKLKIILDDLSTELGNEVLCKKFKD